jgi:DNA polymerase-1
MEMTGIAVDWDKLDDLDKVCREVQGRVKLKFDGLVRGLVEIGSSDSLQQFFDRGHWPKGKRGKKGYSTKAEILEGFEDDHYNCTGVGREAARLILEYRKVSKILSTYTYPLVEMAQQYPDNRLHTSLNPRGAGTGRFTSQAPNSQNFPKRGELADAIRKAFRTSEDKILLGADLSQIEYRLLSHFCGGEMLQSYLDGEDLHNRTAEIMNVPRDDAKTVNFCRIYGGSDQKVFSIIGRQDSTALGRLDGFLAANVDFDRGVEQCLRDRQPVPYVKTISGRKKVLYEPGSEARVFRQAKNAVVQGSAADVMKVGIVNAKKNFGDQWLKVIHPVTTVHDELILEVHREAYQAGKDWIQDTLERSMTTMPESWGLTVPLVAEAKYGSTWKDLK